MQTIPEISAETAANPERIDFVSVVFRGEIKLLVLQARSLAKYIAPEMVEEILLLVNDVNEAACITALERMLHEYGELAGKVRIVPSSEVFRWPNGIAGRHMATRAGLSYYLRKMRKRATGGWRGKSGWYMQQALKLAAARVGDAKHILILDTKNHFLAPCTYRDFVSDTGKARAAPKVTDAYHFKWVTNSYRFFGLPAPDPEKAVMPTTTPYCVEREVLKQTLGAIEGKGTPVQLLFRPQPHEVTEFNLIAAWCAKAHGSWQTVFDLGLVEAHALFQNSTVADVEDTLRHMEGNGAKVFAVHRQVLASADTNTAERIARIWLTAGLIPTLDEGVALFSQGRSPRHR